MPRTRLINNSSENSKQFSMIPVSIERRMLYILEGIARRDAAVAGDGDHE